MLRKIIRKELTEQIREGRFLWATGVICLLLSVSLLVGWRNYTETKDLHDYAQQRERDRWLNQEAKSAHSASHYGVYVFKPQMILSAVDRGVNPFVGVASHLEVHQRNAFSYRQAADSNPLRRFGDLTAATVLQLCVPLLIILVGYNAFVGEREHGTMRQIISLGVDPLRLALGKALVIALPIVGFLIPFWLTVGCITVFAPEAKIGYDIFLRFLLTTLSYLIYFAIFLTITLTVSAWARTSRQALVILVSFWFAACLMLPPILLDLGRWVYPNPTALEFQSQIKSEQAGMKTWYRRLDDVETRLLAEYGVETTGELPVSPSGIALVEQETENDRIQEKHFTDLAQTHDFQHNFYQLFGFISPRLAMQSVSMSTAGTDYLHHRHFAMEAERYRRQMVALMNEAEIKTDPNLPAYIPTDKGRETWETLPPFVYEMPNVDFVVGNQKFSIAVLLGWFVASLSLLLRTVKTMSAI